MTEYQRSIYEIAIQTEWMTENAFIMAWGDFTCLVHGMQIAGNAWEITFINWLLK
jgi:hypothetical protein